MLATITATSCGDPYDLKGRDVLPNVSRIATFPSDFPTFPRHQVAARGHNALSGGSTVRSTLLSAPQLDRYLTRGDYHGKYRHPEVDHQEGCVAVSPDVSSGNHSNTTPTSAAYRHDRQEAKRCAKVKKREQLELVRPFSGQIGRRLLSRHASAVTSDEITSGQPALWAGGTKGPAVRLALRALSRLFRRLFLEKLMAAYAAGRLNFFGDHALLADTQAFATHLAPLRRSANGWSIASARSAAPKRCWPICRPAGNTSRPSDQDRASALLS